MRTILMAALLASHLAPAPGRGPLPSRSADPAWVADEAVDR